MNKIIFGFLCSFFVASSIAQMSAGSEKRPQEMRDQPAQRHIPNVAIRSFDEFCQAIKDSPALNRYAESMKESSNLLGVDSIQYVGVDGKDAILAQWVSNQFNEAFSALNPIEKSQRSIQLISWVTRCAWKLKDENISFAFAPSKTHDFWSTTAKQFEDYQRAASAVARTIDSSGNLSSKDSEKRPFVPHTPALSQQRIETFGSAYINCRTCELLPSRISAMLALLFVNGEKVIQQVSAEQISGIERQMAEFKRKNSESKIAADKEQERVLSIISNGYAYYSKNFSSSKSSCERSASSLFQDEINRTINAAKTAKATKERDDFNSIAQEINFYKDSLARGACFAKFMTEVEAILFNTYLATPDNQVFDGIANSQITEAGRKAINENLALPHQSWLEKRVIAGNRDQSMIALRSSKYTSLMQSYNQIFANNPKLGCTRSATKVSCS